MNILIEEPDIKIVDVGPADSNKTISRFLTRCEQLHQQLKWRVSYSGFDDDPRELIQIPAAQEFSRRLIRLGFLTVLMPPESGKPYIVQNHCPGLDGVGVHAISVGVGDVKRRGRKVNIGMDIDIGAYFSNLLIGLRLRKAHPDVIKLVERVVKQQQEFDPLKGSGHLTASNVVDAEIAESLKDPPWRLPKT